MNISFLIGNGFDLNCGLRTSYRDIYEQYIKKSSGNSQVLSKFKKDLWNDIENWGDFEVAMANHMKEYYSEEDFLECLRDFVDFTVEYLLKEQNALINISDPKICSVISKEMVKSFTEFYTGVTHTLDGLNADHEAFNAIVFNYTSVFDRMYELCYERYPYLDKLIHIHGRLEDDDVVMGMDNIDQINTIWYSLSRKGKRAFIKSEFNKQYDIKRLTDAENIISDSNIICVYGMTLGESDLRWRNQILEWLQADPNAHLFFYRHSCSMLPRMRAEQKMDKEEDEKINLLASWGITGDEVDKYFDQIHIPCCKNIFNIKEVAEKEALKLTAEEITKHSKEKN